MESKEITCVVCPKGCRMSVTVEAGRLAAISGNDCKRGEEYALAECTNPVRTLTTIVRVEGGTHPMAPVRSAVPLPKDLLRDCVLVINKHTLNAPVHVGDIIVHNILDTGVDIIATGNIFVAAVHTHP